jgi:hypothetical protein
MREEQYKKGKSERNKMETSEVFTAVMIEVSVFWVVTPCSVVVGYQSYRGPCCLHPQGHV